MTLWLILLLVWLVGIPAAVLLAAAAGGRRLERRMHSRPALGRSAVRLRLLARCGGRRRPVAQVMAWSARGERLHAAGRRRG